MLCTVREEEGIELQELSNKPVNSSTQPASYISIPLSTFAENAANQGADADSLESGEYEVMQEASVGPSSKIGINILQNCVLQYLSTAKVFVNCKIIHFIQF